MPSQMLSPIRSWTEHGDARPDREPFVVTMTCFIFLGGRVFAFLQAETINGAVIVTGNVTHSM